MVSGMKRICQFVHTLNWGGAETLAYRLATNPDLTNRYEFVFFCLDAENVAHAGSMAQKLIDQKGFNTFYNTQIDGKSVTGFVKEGMFHKAKTRYFITRNKEKLDAAYMEQIYDELRRQAQGENVFNSPEYIK